MAMSTTADLPNPLQIPVVDISGPDSEESIADQLVNAATVHGFVYIKNLGKDILIEDIDRAFDLVGLIHVYDLHDIANYAVSPRTSLHPLLKRNRKWPLQRV
jgi:hypothetical protein